MKKHGSARAPNRRDKQERRRRHDPHEVDRESETLHSSAETAAEGPNGLLMMPESVGNPLEWNRKVRTDGMSEED